MRKNKIFTIALALAVVAAGAQAQTFYTIEEHTNPEDGNKGSYLSNAWYDNWSIGIAGGVQTLLAPGNGKMAFTPDVQFNVSKWVTPSVGFRVGYEGFKLTENRAFEKEIDHYQPKWENGQYKFYQMYLHGDFMVNFSNLFGGYKETRAINIVPYVHAGFYRISHPDYPYFNPKREDGEIMRDREVAFGPAILFNIRITDHLNATIDIKDVFFSARYHDFRTGNIAQNPSAAIGLNYTFKKWYWTRLKVAESGLRSSLDDANRALLKAEENNAKLQLDVAELEKEIDALKNSIVPKDVVTTRIKNADLLLLFDINVANLKFPEQVHLDRYVRATLAEDANHVFYITGCADKGTGSERFNAQLCRARAEHVKNLLKTKYNVPVSQIVIKATLISNAHEDGRLDRCVILENE